MLQTSSEIKYLKEQVSKTIELPGAMAEVGVFNGESAREISLTCYTKPLYLFDTFSGLPEVSENDGEGFKKGDYITNEEVLAKNLSGRPGITKIKGLFPESANILDEVKFCFVHLDCDLYKSIKDSLLFFIPKMVPGGIILIHDTNAKGVLKALNEVLDSFENTGSQGVWIKGKNLQKV